MPSSSSSEPHSGIAVAPDADVAPTGESPRSAVQGFDAAGRIAVRGKHENLPTGACDVLVVGGGPVGLLCATLLAKRGVDTVLVERHPGTSLHPKARGVSVRSMEILRELGLADDLAEMSRAAVGDVPHMCIADTLAAEQFTRMPLPSTESSFSMSRYRGALVAQDVLEQRLLAAAREQRSLRAHFGVRAELVSQVRDGVTVALTDVSTGTGSAVQARFVVAADGSRSPIREALGITSTGERDLAQNINVLFEAPLADLVVERPSVLFAIRHPGAEGVLLAVDGRTLWLYNFPLLNEMASDYDENRLVARIRSAVGVDRDVRMVSAVHWSTNAVVADRYRSGAVMLVGDAAHVTPPNGAFGMNIGLADAHNLAWKLVAVITGESDESLLDTYEAERRPVAIATVGVALDQFRSGPGAGTGGRPGAPAIDPVRLDLGYRYRSASVLIDPSDDGVESESEPFAPTGRPGERVPAVSLTSASVGPAPQPGDSAQPAHTVSSLTLHDLIAAQATLIAGPRCGANWDRVVRIDGSTIADGKDLDGCLRSLGIDADGAVLVRPDGVVAWRCPSNATTDAVAVAAARVLHHPHRDLAERATAANQR
jgi:putative polyketide hydroxylase